MSNTYEIKPGYWNPFGACPDAEGVNFCIFSRHATCVELLLYHRANSEEPFQIISLNPEVYRTFFSWHVYVVGLPVGTWYAWRVDGPNDTWDSGNRFDNQKNLLDPWARAVSDHLWDRNKASKKRENGHASMRCMVVDNRYNWEGDQPLKCFIEHSIIYEVHVGGYTRHPSSNVNNPGKFSGLIEKIPYLLELGVTHVELLPVMAFDEQDIPEGNSNLGLKNYWGYSTHSFFSPHPGYCISPEQGTHQKEFRDMVKAMHKAGIGVILDVVFNHTSEGGKEGPTINFKGLGNSVFYHLDCIDKNNYRDYTGCGNTVNANHPLVANFIISCLEYWVREMHVDGFRFDLASALARGENGEPMHNAPVLWGIEFSEQLAESKLIAEAWDAAGLYQVGSFPGYRWAEWNGQYRDIIRRFVRGDQGLIGELATRMTGSSDFYQYQGRLPINSINFVTCHDGFTLNDLVSYNEKHNSANGENNSDGSNNNHSFNYGVEGKTDDPRIQHLRRQQVKNFFTILMLSQGIPMLLAGDEVLHSQQGNNNVYCQDNELSWFDWHLIKHNSDMLRYVQLLIRLRKSHPSLMRKRFLTGSNQGERETKDIAWYSNDLKVPDWNDVESRFLAFSLAAVEPDESDLCVMMNMSTAMVEMSLPEVQERTWHLVVDTAKASPHDIVDPDRRIPYKTFSYAVQPHSTVVMEGS